MGAHSYDESFVRLSDIERFDKDWDSYDADPIGPVVIERARVLLSALRDKGATEPFVSPVCFGANGSGLQLEWGSDDPDWLEVDLRQGDIEVAGKYGGADVFAAFRDVTNPALAFDTIAFLASRLS